MALATRTTTEEGLSNILRCKWTLRILLRLLVAPAHPGHLQRHLAPLSRKVLYQRLGELERSGLIERRVSTGYPLSVELRLTEQGLTLAQAAQALQDAAGQVDIAEMVLHCRWMRQVLSHLAERGPLRSSVLRQMLPGISNKVLAERLARLCKWGLVTREEGPCRVIYSLTARGKEFQRAAALLKDWFPREGSWQEVDGRARVPGQD